MSLPERRYDLAGHLLAQAVDEAERTGQPPRTILDRRAYELGEQLAAAARPASGQSDVRVLTVLTDYGFEPRVEGAAIILANCPFHTLAKEHTDLVCGMNLQLLTGLLAGIGQTAMRARPAPAEGYCCVRLEPAE